LEGLSAREVILQLQDFLRLGVQGIWIGSKKAFCLQDPSAAQNRRPRGLGEVWCFAAEGLTNRNEEDFASRIWRIVDEQNTIKIIDQATYTSCLNECESLGVVPGTWERRRWERRVPWSRSTITLGQEHSTAGPTNEPEWARAFPLSTQYFFEC
jgi:hypothetical protein